MTPDKGKDSIENAVESAFLKATVNKNDAKEEVGVFSKLCESAIEKLSDLASKYKEDENRSGYFKTISSIEATKTIEQMYQSTINLADSNMNINRHSELIIDQLNTNLADKIYPSEFDTEEISANKKFSADARHFYNQASNNAASKAFQKSIDNEISGTIKDTFKGNSLFEKAGGIYTAVKDACTTFLSVNAPHEHLINGLRYNEPTQKSERTPENFMSLSKDDQDRIKKAASDWYSKGR